MKKIIQSKMINVSIAKKLILSYATIIVLFFAVTMSGVGYIFYTNVLNKAFSYLQGKTKLICKSIEMNNREIENYAKIFSVDDYIQSGLLEYDTLDKNTRYSYNNNIIRKSIIYSIAVENDIQCLVMDTEGDIAFQQTYISFPVEEVAELISVNKVDEWKAIQIMDDDGFIQDAYILFIKSIYNLRSGKFLGYITSYINEQDFCDSYIIQGEGNNGNVIVTDSSGCVISSTEKNYIGKNISTLPFDCEYNSNTDSVEKCFLDGKKYYVDVQEMECGWKVWNFIDYRYVMENNYISIIWTAGIGVLGLLVSIGMSLLLTKAISTPIMKLVKATREISDGNLQMRVNFLGKDEIGILGHSFNKMMDRIAQLMENIYKEQEEKKNLEIRLVQAQITPHFLYNSFESIISFIKLKRDTEAIQQIRSLAGFYRISLSGGADMILLRQEIELTRCYLEIQKVRYSDIMDYQLVFDETLLNYMVPKLTIQPIVENAIYHGIKEKCTKGIIHIGVERQQDCILIRVYDNGKGISKDKLEMLNHNLCSKKSEEGFGLYSVNQRIRLLYGMKFGISLDSVLGEYTEVRVLLPIEGS